MPTITIHEATVQTVQIEIKALKVGKKQVTMGLFRQLPMQALFSIKTLDFRGIPWGWVNYFWDGCLPREESDWMWPQGTTSLQVVWQGDDRLYRAVCRSNPPLRVIGRPEDLLFAQDPDYQQRWRRHWQTLKAMPQLFIAV